MAEFVHLRLHTEYSLIDSVVRVPELASDVHDIRLLAELSDIFMAGGV